MSSAVEASPATSSADAKLSPYPGLRPFFFEDHRFFFGRETQVDELLQRLRKHRFLAVIGESGSGKSSLVRAGLQPALAQGFLFEAKGSWLTATFEPGSDPFGRLAAKLTALYQDPDSSISTSFVETVLRTSPLGLVETARGILKNSEASNLLVVADQFEELFPDRSQDTPQAKEDRAAFVSLLLEAVKQTAVPVYVLLTMRSDFLGRAQEFRGLPQAMNDVQFLVPRMGREELRIAITAPPRVLKSDISPTLVEKLLNEISDDQDQLPVLQHALARTWDLHLKRTTKAPIDLK